MLLFKLFLPRQLNLCFSSQYYLWCEGGFESTFMVSCRVVWEGGQLPCGDQVLSSMARISLQAMETLPCWIQQKVSLKISPLLAFCPHLSFPYLSSRLLVMYIHSLLQSNSVTDS